jgi:predicted RNase H-like HicB family nuclease
MGMQGHVTAVFEQHDDWYIAYVEEIPGVNTQGRTLEEARENLRDALHGILELNRELARRENPHALREMMAVEAA